MAQQGSFKLEEGEKITAVMVNHGYIVDGIGFEITDKSGKTNNKWFSDSNEGALFEYVSLDPKEYITQISGTYGKYFGNDIYIATIKIHTNLHPVGYGPYGRGQETQDIESFSTPLPLDGPIVGFFTSYGPYLASIGIYVTMIERHGPYGREDSSPNWSIELEEGQRFSKILVDHGYIVDGVGFEITDAKGNSFIKKFSGSGGSSSEIPLGSDEYITQITGQYGEYYDVVNITSIKIHTNLRPDGYGPYGESKNTVNVKPFSTPLQLSAAIVGFFGYYGTYFGSIGIIYKYYGVQTYGPYGRP